LRYLIWNGETTLSAYIFLTSKYKMDPKAHFKEMFTKIKKQLKIKI